MYPNIINFIRCFFGLPIGKQKNYALPIYACWQKNPDKPVVNFELGWYLWVGLKMKPEPDMDQFIECLYKKELYNKNLLFLWKKADLEVDFFVNFFLTL